MCHPFLSTPLTVPALPIHAEVLIPVALDRAYSYGVPEGKSVVAGDIVSVTLGKKASVGVVWAVSDAPPRTNRPLKDIDEVLGLPPLPAALMRFIDWVAAYNLAPRGMVLRMALRFDRQLGPERLRIGVRWAGSAPSRTTKARSRLLDLLTDGMVRPKGEAAREAGVSLSVIDGLVDEGVLEAVTMPGEAVAPAPDADHMEISLSPAQLAAADEMAQRVRDGGAGVVLLDGVTGSGKTETYFEAVAEVLRSGGQALVLLPEIALTTAFLDRFTRRFGVAPLEWHSQLSPRRRDKAWRNVASGEARVVVGARSALMLPFAALKLIIVDEEHDPAYKQSDGITYHARDMAVVRGQIEKIPVVLASATPSVESRVNADRGRYTRLVLPERFSGAALPPLASIDLRREAPPPGRWLSPRLIEAVGQTLEKGEQALLFLNRRGYAPLTLCKACGFRMRCPHCASWLVEHRFRRQLVCHHCGHTEPKPPACPNCQTADSFVACGPGVERLAEEAAQLFPQARQIILSSDMTGGVERLRQELDEIAEGRFDIIIGTQLVAKGHHFPKLTLVGVVDADLGLGQGDPRAAERTFQLLHQVVGRAGREARAGRGFLQTHMPEHPVIAALVSGDPEAFYANEIAMREEAGLPPFGRLASLIISARTAAEAEADARRLALLAPADPLVRVLGPAEAPVALLRGRHRWRLLAKAPRGHDLSAYVRQWLDAAPAPKVGLERHVDIDPQSFL